MISTIYLRDFRRHATLSLSFGEGMNGLFGSNYAGKTSVLLAVAVALGGAGVAARGWRLIRRGAAGFEIQLGLQIRGKEYRLLRTNSGAKLWQGEKLLATGHGPVNAEISSLIGMPVAQWLELRFVRQKAAAAMFEAGASKLNLLVEDLTGAHTVTRVIGALGKRADQAKAEAETCRSLAASEEQISLAQTDLKTHQDQKAKAEAAAASLPGKLAKLEADAAQMEKLSKQQAASLQAARKDLQASAAHHTRLETLRGQLAATPDLASAASYLDHAENLRGDLLQWEDWIGRYRPALFMLGRASEQLGKIPPAGNLDGLAKKIQAAEEAQVDADTKANEASLAAGSALAEAKAKLKAAADAEQQLADGVCSACRRPFEGASDAHREELQATAKRLREEAETQRATATEQEGVAATWKRASASHRTAAKDLATELRKASEAENTRKVLSAQVEELTEQVKALEAETENLPLEKAEEQITWLKSEIAATGRLADQATSRAQLQTQLAKLQVEKVPDLADLEQQIAALEAEASSNATDLRDVSVEATELRAALSAELQQARVSTDMVARLSAYLDEQDQIAVRLSAANQVLANAGELVKYLRGSRSRYLANAWELILGRASAFADALTSGAISGLLRTEEGQFKFMEGAEEAGVDEASGAQAAILGLGVQIGLAETLPTHLDLLLVDEPTADMDAEHSAAAILALSTCAKQVVAISHHRMDETLCNQTSEL